MSARTLTGPASPVTRLARGGTVNVAGSLVGGLAGIALVVVVTNGFPRQVAGMLFAATSFTLIVAAVAELGTDAGLAHTVQRHLAGGRPDGARAVVRIAVRPVVALSLAVAAAAWYAAPWLAGLLVGTDGDPADMTAMLRVLAVALPVATTYDTLLAATRAYGTMRPNVVIEKLGRLPGQIACVAVVQLLGLGPGWLAAAWAFPYFLGLFAVGGWLRRIVGAQPPGPPADVHTRVHTGASGLAREFWAFTTPRAFGRICQVALQRADIVLVAALLSPRHAAVYTAATRFLSLGQLGTQAIQQVLLPQVSGLFARGDAAGVREVFRTSTAWLMALSWPVYLASAVAAPLVLNVFGEGYAGGRTTLVILALTMLVASACGPVDVVLLMAGRSRTSLANNATALAVDLLLAVALIPVLGITGAAVAWSAALLVRNALPMTQVRRAFGMVSFGRGVAWVAASAGLCFGVVPLLVSLAVPLTLPVAALLFPPLCLLYAGLLWRGRRVLRLRAFASVVPRRARVALSTAGLRRPGLVELPLDRILLGVQDGVPLDRYARECDDLLWGSTPVAAGPHAALLRMASPPSGTAPSDTDILESTYGEHARRCLRLTGRYFWATDEAGVVEVARAFLAQAFGPPTTNGGPRPAATSGPGDPILVAPIRDSDCFQVVDGHHRLARLAHEGAPSARVKVKRISVNTPLQDLLSQMSWLGGTKELYQPVDAPELRRRWTTVRRCTDRLALMTALLEERGLGGHSGSSRRHDYLDVASCYGWFVQRMAAQGYAAEGVERDPLARRLGAAVYGLDPDRIHVRDAVHFLRAAEAAGRRWDVVSCFSLLHHFVLGRGGTTAEDLVRLLDTVTGRVLFLDTGQDHEAWFARSLAGWNTDRVRAFLLAHATFDEVIDLGPDRDAVPPYDRNYGRHLFACLR